VNVSGNESIAIAKPPYLVNFQNLQGSTSKTVMGLDSECGNERSECMMAKTV
jgi:hypothetical protein